MGNMITDSMGTRLSPAEVEHTGPVLFAYNVEMTPIYGDTKTVPVLAEDSVAAINCAFEILFPDWNTNKPTSGMKVKVIAFDRRA